MSVNTLSRPHVVRLEQPDGFYALHFYRATLKSILGSHKLLSHETPVYWTTFQLAQAEQQRWMALFGVREGMPFTYANKAATLSLMHILADRGVNLKQVRHVKTELTHSRTGMQPGEVYTVTTELCDLIAMRKDRAVLITETTIFNDTGSVFILQKDYWLVLNLPHIDVALVDQMHWYRRHDVSPFENLSKRQPQLLDTALSVKIDIPKNMGLRYGPISGDLNPTHLHPITARLFAHTRPFIQGYCTVNYVIKHLTELTGEPLYRLQITFMRPIYTGQAVTLRFENDHFEICNEKQQLLATGTWISKQHLT